MDDFFCKTRLFWACTRMLLAIAIVYDLFFKDKYGEISLLVITINCILFIYSVSFLVIGINEIREKESNILFLKIIGILSILFAIALVSITIGALKSGYGILLFVAFIWLVLIGIKDILGNQYYLED